MAKDKLSEYSAKRAFDVTPEPAGKVDEGRLWLKKAFRLGDAKDVRNIALADPDLEVLWPELTKAAA